jgi:ribonuclease D
MKYTLIETEADLTEFRKKLCHENVKKIAMDFEGEFNLHAYGEKLCLIQIFDGKNNFIIDPLKINDNEIKKLLEDRHTIKVMYGVESDVSLVYSQYDVQIKNIFDQKILVDLLNIEHSGLDFVLKHFLNIDIKNKKKYQCHNWLNRPLDNDAIQYALNDVGHLLELNKKLIEEIKLNNKYDELIYGLIRRNYNPIKDKIAGIFKKPEYKMLSNENKNIFEKIYKIRDNYAREYNVPPFYVLTNELLFDLINGKKTIDNVKISSKLSKNSQVEMKNKIREIIKEI